MASSTSAPERAPATAAIEYPSSDGKPMADGDAQLIPLIYAVDRLRHYFRRDPDVYVSGNLLIYYEEGNPKRRVAPDVFVVFGAPDRMRPNYLLWEEPKAPDFVLEITSPKKWRLDQGPKRTLYQRLGVREYWQYDPTGDYLAPSLQGRELVAGRYEALPARKFEHGTLAAWSAVLGLELRLVERGLRFYDPRTCEELPDLAEADDKRKAAEARAEQEAELRRRATATWRENEGRRREGAARQAAETRLQEEVAARQAVEARVAELEALLRRGPDRNSKKQQH